MKKEHTSRSGMAVGIKKLGSSLEKIAVVVLLSLCAVIFCGLVYYGARYTWLDAKGIPYEIRDNAGMNILVLLVLTAAIFLLYRISCNKHMTMIWEGMRARIPYIIAGISVCLYIVSAVWVTYCHIQPVGDGMALCHVAHRMITGNFIDMKEKGYMLIFPHQFGLLSVIHAIFTWFGAMNYKVFQYINAACIPLLFYSGYQIIKFVYDKIGAIISYILFFITCLPLLFYLPYVYGEVISITFTMVLMWQVIRFCKTGKKSSLLWGTIAIVIACFVRNNSLIILVAVGIVLCIHALKEANPRGMIWLLVMFLLVSGSQHAIHAYYEKISGIQVSEGVPYISWVRMGLQDSWTGPGWFDNTSIEMYAAHGYDTEQTILAEKELLQGMLKDMWENKPQSIDFFRRKILSQWNSPGYYYTYEARTFDCEQYELPNFVRRIYYDNEAFVQTFLNRYQFLVYFYAGLLAVLLLLDKKKRGCLTEHLLYIAIIGGFLFTIIWESGSRYVLPYLMYMLPLAGMGICRLVKMLDMIFKGKRKVVKGE